MAQRKPKASAKRRRQKKIRALLLLCAAAVLIIAAIVAIIIIIVNIGKNRNPAVPTAPAVETTGSGSTDDKTDALSDKAETGKTSDKKTGNDSNLPGPPSPKVASTASFGATGDILLHNSVLKGADNGDGTYDFSKSFSEVSSYWSALDYMIVNLEVPCGGDNDPTGYPTFDAPDEIVRDLKNAGVDMCLTATNHTNDCGGTGLLHTQDVLNEYGLDYVGTRQSENDSYVLTKDINGIKFGFACYTYDTRQDPSDQKSLNGIPLSDEAENLVNSFCYSDLDTFYASVQNDLAQMKGEGCDVTVFFVHWGDEYTDYPNGYQTEMAQEMCDLGVDVIIGGHPHVIQEFDVLNGKNGNSTYCLYSLGNAISSQRKEIMVPEEPRGYTEDGIVMQFSYTKFNNGKSKLTGVDILPTWVEPVDGVFYIEPLSVDAAQSDWPVISRDEAIASYDRTIGRIGDVYQELKNKLESISR